MLNHSLLGGFVDENKFPERRYHTTNAISVMPLGKLLPPSAFETTRDSTVEVRRDAEVRRELTEAQDRITQLQMENSVLR